VPIISAALLRLRRDASDVDRTFLTHPRAGDAVRRTCVPCPSADTPGHRLARPAQTDWAPRNHCRPVRPRASADSADIHAKQHQKSLRQGRRHIASTRQISDMSVTLTPARPPSQEQRRPRSVDCDSATSMRRLGLAENPTLSRPGSAQALLRLQQLAVYTPGWPAHSRAALPHLPTLRATALERCQLYCRPKYASRSNASL